MDWKNAVSETKRCLYCDGRFHEDASWSWAFGLKDEVVLCPGCEKKLSRISVIGCDMCGRQPATSAEEAKFVNSGVKMKNKFVKTAEHLCKDCREWQQSGKPKLQHRAIYTYNGFMQDVMARYKYRGDAELAGIFAADVKKLVRGLGRQVTAVPIPLHGERKWERGFNQAALLGGELELANLLVRRRAAEKQSKRTRSERIEALKGAFRMSEEGKRRDFSGRKIVLIDDIYTTGATLRAAADVFYEAGAAEVFAVTVARATGGIG